VLSVLPFKVQKQPPIANMQPTAAALEQQADSYLAVTVEQAAYTRCVGSSAMQQDPTSPTALQQVQLLAPAMPQAHTKN
jgi:hypothetical protein